jgi:hypothetical protein
LHRGQPELAHSIQRSTPAKYSTGNGESEPALPAPERAPSLGNVPPATAYGPLPAPHAASAAGAVAAAVSRTHNDIVISASILAISAAHLPPPDSVTSGGGGGRATPLLPWDETFGGGDGEGEALGGEGFLLSEDGRRVETLPIEKLVRSSSPVGPACF